MKLLTSLVVIFTGIHTVFSQQPEQRFLEGGSNRFIEFKGDTAFLFIDDGALVSTRYFIDEYIPVDTLYASGTTAYTGENSELVRDDAQYLLTMRTGDKHHRVRKMPMRFVSDERANEKFNRSWVIWELRELQYEMEDNEYVNPYTTVNLHRTPQQFLEPYKTTDYRIARSLITADIQRFKDSLFAVNKIYTELTDLFIARIATADVESTIDFLKRIPKYNEYGYLYYRATIEEMAIERTDLFFEVAEHLPEQKEAMFYCCTAKEQKKALKNAVTDSQVQKEYKKFKRRDTMFSISAVSLYTLGNVAFWGGIAYLIFH